MKEKQVSRICCASKDLPPRASLVNRGMNTCELGVLGPSRLRFCFFCVVCRDECGVRLV